MEYNFKKFRIRDIKQYTINPLYKNSFYLISNSLVGSFLGFIFWMVAAKLYNTEEVGISTAIFSAIGLISALSQIGLDTSVIRYFPETKNKTNLINICIFIPFILSLLLSSVYLLGLNIWSPKLSILTNFRYSLLFVTFAGAYTIYSLLSNIYVAGRSAKFSFFLSTFWASMKIPFLIALSSLGLLGIFNSWGFVTILSSVIGIIAIKKLYNEYKLKIKFEKELLIKMINYSLSNYIAGLLFSSPILVLPIILANYLNPSMATFFYISWMIAGLFYTVIGVTNLSLFAECSHDIKALKNNIFSALKLILLIIVPGTIVVALFSDKILLIFGKSYSENASTLLILLVLSSFPYAINQMFITLNKVKMKKLPIIYFNAFTSVCLFSIVFATIGQMGIISVGIGWLTAQSVSSLIASVYVYKTYFVVSSKIL